MCRKAYSEGNFIPPSMKKGILFTQNSAAGHQQRAPEICPRRAIGYYGVFEGAQPGSGAALPIITPGGLSPL